MGSIARLLAPSPSRLLFSIPHAIPDDRVHNLISNNNQWTTGVNPHRINLDGWSQQPGENKDLDVSDVNLYPGDVVIPGYPSTGFQLPSGRGQTMRIDFNGEVDPTHFIRMIAHTSVFCVLSHANANGDPLFNNRLIMDFAQYYLAGSNGRAVFYVAQSAAYDTTAEFNQWYPSWTSSPSGGRFHISLRRSD